MKTDTLYTANKYNKNLFGIGGWNLLAGLDRKASAQYGANYGNDGFTLEDFINRNPLVKAGNIISSFSPALTGLIGNGYSTNGVGETVSTVGNAVGEVAGAIPVIGGIAKPAVKLFSSTIGGLINRGWGVKENKANIASIKDNTASARTMGNTLGSSSSNEGLLTASGNMAVGSGFKAGDLYKNGWFTNKGTKKGNALINNENSALAYQRHGLLTGANNVDSYNDFNIMSNFAAYGGPLDYLGNDNNMGAIEYDFMSRYLDSKDKQASKADKLSGISPTVINTFAKGGCKCNKFGEGGIEIKHPGRLTALKERTGKTEAELWAEGKPSVRKMITFARNSRKWKKALGGYLDARDNLLAFGGDMQTNGSDFPTGLTHVNAGSTHELNPNEGVQVGVDPEGTPNLVEEGEVIFNDYVYSNRIELDEEAKKKFHFSKKANTTFADAAKKLEKEVSERPNDPISKAAFKAQMETLANEQERQKQEMEAERAKQAFESLSPEEQVALMQQAAQQEQIAQQQAMAEQPAEEQPTEEMAMQSQMSPEEAAMMQQQQVPPEEQLVTQQNQPEEYACGGKVNKYSGTDEDTQQMINENNVEEATKEALGLKEDETVVINPVTKEVVPALKKEWPRYAGLFGPVVGLGMMAAGIGKPNYKRLNAAIEAFDKQGVSQATYKPIGNYLTYKPMDVWQNQNRMDANARATNRAITNSSAPIGTRMAGLLANNYTSQLGSGELYKQALMYNDALNKQVQEFNRGTDQYNSQTYNQNSMFNAQMRNRDKQMRASLAMQAAKEILDSDAGRYNSLYGNVSGLFKGISDLGRENYQHNQLARLVASGAIPGIVPESAMNSGWVKYANKSACGGKLNKAKKNKRKGLTF